MTASILLTVSVVRLSMDPVLRALSHRRNNYISSTTTEMTDRNSKTHKIFLK